MPTDLKNQFRLWATEARYGPAYIYVQTHPFARKYRFFVRIWGSPRMWQIVREWHDRGASVSIWRPPSYRTSHSSFC